MREIDITTECEAFLDSLDERSLKKFDYVLQIMLESKVISEVFVKKIESSPFFEMRIRTSNEYRIILFTIDHSSFIEANRVVLLKGFVKKTGRIILEHLRKQNAF